MDRSSEALTNAGVLIVEDEPLILMMVEDMLADLGCAETHGVASSEQAVRILEHDRVDVGILDIHLASETSFKLAELLRDRNIPFLFASGSMADELPDEFRDIPLILKPFSSETLHDGLERVLLQSPAIALAARPELTAANDH